VLSAKDLPRAGRLSAKKNHRDAQVTVTAHFAESWAISRQRIFFLFSKKKLSRESTLDREIFFLFFTKLFAESYGTALGKEFFLKKIALPRAMAWLSAKP